MGIVLKLLTSKAVWAGLLLVIALGTIGFLKHKIQGLEADLEVANGKVVQSETLREQCNLNVGMMNAEIEVHAAKSKRELVEREKLLENINDLRFEKESKVVDSRVETRIVFRDSDCAATGMHLDVVGMLDLAQCQANKRVCH